MGENVQWRRENLITLNSGRTYSRIIRGASLNSLKRELWG